MRIAFAIIVGVAAIRMLTESKTQAQRKIDHKSKPSLFGLMAVGLIAGMVSAPAGIGGGVFKIPMMYYFLNMPLKLAIGTSSATIVITALFLVVGYILNGLGRTGLPEWSIGFVDFQRGIPLIIGTFLLARVGAYVSFRTHPYRLRILFALFIISLSMYMLVR